MNGFSSSLFFLENRRLGQLAAAKVLRHSALSGPDSRGPHLPEDASFPLALMKKKSRHDHPSEASRRSHRDCRKQNGKDGRWVFNLASESLFPLGSTDRARRVAYRMADGTLRFLPL